MSSRAIVLAISSIAGMASLPARYDVGSDCEPMPATKIFCLFRVLPETRRSHGYDLPSTSTKNLTIAVTSAAASALLRMTFPRGLRRHWRIVDNGLVFRAISIAQPGRNVKMLSGLPPGAAVGALKRECAASGRFATWD
jgi:hypothetical protein